MGLLSNSPVIWPPLSPTPGRSAAELTGTAYRLFKEWKKHPSPRLDRWVRNQLTTDPEQWSWIQSNAHFLHPIPQASARSAQLGHWPAGDLAALLKKKTGLPIAQLLKPHTSGTQGKRSLSERRQSLLVFEAVDVFPEALQRLSARLDARILLIDDIRTTGGTIDSAAAALRQLGFTQIYGWTLGLRPAARRHCSIADPTP